MRQAKETMSTDVGFEFFLRMLYGSRYHGLSGHLPLKLWKTQLLRLFETVRNALEKNVTGDEHHKAHMIELCQIAMQAITDEDSKDQINCDALRFTFMIVFELLGRFPDNWGSRHPHHSCVTELSTHRTLAYVRTAKQRAREITDAAYSNKLQAKDPQFEVLIDKLRGNFRDDPHKFLKWIKAEYPSLYERFE